MCDMNEKTTLNIRIDSELKNKAESIIDELGLSTSSAIVLFFKAIVRYEGLPFDVKLAKEPRKLEAKLVKEPRENKRRTPKASSKKPRESDSLRRAIDKL